MYRFWHFGLKLPIHVSIGQFLDFGGTFSPRDRASPIVLTPKKDSTWAETREPFSVRISATVRLGRVIKKKGRYNKSHKSVIFLIFCGSPTLLIRPKSCMVGNVHDVITCVKFQIEIFMGYDFTGSRIFDFPIVFFCMCLTTVKRALPVMCVHITNRPVYRCEAPES